ncbi:MAG: hypothetical protein MK098_10510 [Marinovum sp.]|nr:hypothetical protein [Marinovum sp.]
MEIIDKTLIRIAWVRRIHLTAVITVFCVTTVATLISVALSVDRENVVANVLNHILMDPRGFLVAIGTPSLLLMLPAFFTAAIERRAQRRWLLDMLPEVEFRKLLRVRTRNLKKAGAIDGDVPMDFNRDGFTWTTNKKRILVTGIVVTKRRHLRKYDELKFSGRVIEIKDFAPASPALLRSALTAQFLKDPPKFKTDGHEPRAKIVENWPGATRKRMQLVAPTDHDLDRWERVCRVIVQTLTKGLPSNDGIEFVLSQDGYMLIGLQVDAAPIPPRAMRKWKDRYFLRLRNEVQRMTALHQALSEITDDTYLDAVLGKDA